MASRRHATSHGRRRGVLSREVKLMLPTFNGAMRGRRVRWSVARALVSIAFGALPLGAQSPTRVQPPRTASLGTCRLSTGAILAPCQVAYRTYGQLSPARDNVVLIPTFFAGRSEDHLFMLGTYVDTTRHHV